jgi:glyoxylase-like metal-dependent hydrolase (beta-lactamase superfamily II)
MKRALPLLLSLALASCAITPQRERAIVDRALDAMGGAVALGNVKSIYMHASMRQWEPEQSYTAGGEMKFAADSTFEVLMDLSADTARVDWARNLVYPTTRSFKFSEIVTPGAGYVLGIDSNTRNKQNLESNPPGHAMSSLRLAATQRELKRASPLLLLEMRDNPGRVSASPDIGISGVDYPAVNYQSGGQIFTVLFDPQTGLPARIRTIDYDNINGDSTYDLALSDWRAYGAIRLPVARQYQFNGKVIGDIRIAEIVVNAPVGSGSFAIPAAAKAAAAKPASGNMHYQWVLRRQIIGTYIDSENTSFDAQTTSDLRLTELAPGVQHQAAGSAHSLIVEMRDYLIVFDAPVTDWQSNWTMKAAKDKYPGKPVKYLVLTHHHMDHAGGFRAYAAAGAILVVGMGNGAHFRRLLAAPATLNPDLAARDLSHTPVVEVADRHVFSDGKREVLVILTENPHAKNMVIGYVSDARLGFVTDLWAPGRDVLKDKLNPAQAALVSTVQKAGIAPLKFAGGHGSSSDYAPLAALAAK